MHRSEYESEWSALTSIASKIGCTVETLRKWVLRQAERDQGVRAGLTSDERERLKALEPENRRVWSENFKVYGARKVFSLQTLPACDEPFDDSVGKVAGFSLHAGVAARADERRKLERLCRYIARPAASEKRLSLTGNGHVRYQIKTPYRRRIPLQGD